MGNEHWVECKLSDITTKPQYGWTTKTIKSGKYKYFRTTDIDSSIDWQTVPYCAELPQNPNEFTIRKGDILISRAGSIGKSILFDEDQSSVIFASYLIRFKVIAPIESKFINYYLKTKEYWTFIIDEQAGIAIPNINASKLANLPILLPPVNEQKHIAEKLDALLPRIKNVKAQLEKIPVILKKFRQSVLAAACSGKLTEDWREGKDLQLWEKISANKLFSFVTSGSRGWAKYYSESGSLFLRIGNLNHSTIYLDMNKKQYVNLPKNTEGIRTRVKENDILISITADVGMIAIIPANFETAYINQHIALARPNDKVYPKYLAWFLASSNAQYQFQSLQRGATKAGLGLEDIKKIIVPVPPLPEQQEIVNRVEKLFTLADSLEIRYQKALEQLEKLEQAVLAKAFRGELAEPDPNDEPAEVLLERILVEKRK